MSSRSISSFSAHSTPMAWGTTPGGPTPGSTPSSRPTVSSAHPSHEGRAHAPTSSPVEDSTPGPTLTRAPSAALLRLARDGQLRDRPLLASRSLDGAYKQLERERVEAQMKAARERIELERAVSTVADEDSAPTSGLSSAGRSLRERQLAPLAPPTHAPGGGSSSSLSSPSDPGAALPSPLHRTLRSSRHAPESLPTHALGGGSSSSPSSMSSPSDPSDALHSPLLRTWRGRQHTPENLSGPALTAEPSNLLTAESTHSSRPPTAPRRRVLAQRGGPMLASLPTPAFGLGTSNMLTASTISSSSSSSTPPLPLGENASLREGLPLRPQSVVSMLTPPMPRRSRDLPGDSPRYRPGQAPVSTDSVRAELSLLEIEPSPTVRTTPAPAPAPAPTPAKRGPRVREGSIRPPSHADAYETTGRMPAIQPHGAMGGGGVGGGGGGTGGSTSFRRMRPSASTPSLQFGSGPDDF